MKYHRYLGGCRLAIIEHAGHWAYREQPEAFTRIVRSFLDDLPPG